MTAGAGITIVETLDRFQAAEKVPVKLSQLAVVGWTVNVEAERRAGEWIIIETGFYP